MFTEQLQFIPKPEYIRHGGAYDRGSADAWYAREYQPHYFKGASYDSEQTRWPLHFQGERMNERIIELAKQYRFWFGKNKTFF